MTAKNKKVIKKEWIILIIILVIGLLYYKKESASISGSWDISQQVNQMGYDQYLIEENDFDYSDPSIYNLAVEIKQRTNNPTEAIKETISYVARNIQYSSSITTNYCYDEKASTVLKSGFGDCVSMSRLVTALLRAQGIPSRTMGGCISFASRCAPTFSVFPPEETQAMVTAMEEDDFKKRGFLHEWVEVWTPNEKWQIIEATTGQIFPLNCGSYIEFGYDSNRLNRCVINDADFWNECRVSI